MISARKSASVFTPSFAPPVRQRPRLVLFESVIIQRKKPFLSRRSAVASLATMALLLPLLFLVGVRVAQLQAAYSIAKLETQRVELDQERRVLELEISVLKRPDRIERLAETKLGLNPPSEAQFLRLSQRKQ